MPNYDPYEDPDEPVSVVEADEDFIRVLETLDVDWIMDRWSFTEMVTMQFPGIPLAIGREEVENAWEKVSRNTSRLRSQLKIISVIRNGNMGYTFQAGSIITTHGDETLTIEVYMTNVFILEEGDWRLVHHHTTPAPHQPMYFEQRMN